MSSQNVFLDQRMKDGSKRANVKLAQNKKPLARAIALALMAGCVAVPATGWATIVEGYKFNDLNDNKIMDANEPRLADETITIRLNTTAVQVDPAPTTDANGYYRVDVDEQTSVTVWSRIMPTGWVQTTPREGTGMLPYTVAIPPDNSNIRVDIGVRDPNAVVVVPPLNSTPQQVTVTPSTVNVQVGSEVTFHGSFVDTDAGDTHTVAWAFGDGSVASGLDTRHIYTSPGNYQVTLTVTDSQKAVGTAVVAMVVSPKPNTVPQVSVTPSAVNVQAGSEITFKGSFVDPDVGDTQIVGWTFGDGSVANTIEARHAYSSPGNYTVTLTVTDSQKAVGTAKVVVAVTPKSNTAPVANAGKDVVAHTGEQVPLTGSVVDPDLNDTHTFEWNFGDGSNVSATQNASHIYTKAGSFAATLTVKDKQGAVGTDRAEVKVYPSVGWTSFDAANPVAQTTPPDLDTPITDSQELVVDINVPGATVVELTEGGIVYHQFNIPQEAFFEEIGKPQVPMVSRMIAVPKGAVAKIEVLDYGIQEVKGYNIYPAQEPLSDQANAPLPAFAKDEALYGRNEFFPATIAKLDDTGVVRGTSVASLRIFPVQFNPVTQTLRIYSNIRVKVSFEGGMDNFTDVRTLTPSYKRLLEPLLLNANTALSMGDADTAYEPGNSLLIITHPTFLAAANTLAAWKIKKGIYTTVKTTTEIGGTAVAIQTYIRNAYTNATASNPPPSYVLFVGDAEFIPTNYQTEHPAYGFPTGTDLYYATVVGTDYFPDIYLGRLSVDTLAQATKRINDIINYEKAIVTDSAFYQKATVATYFQDRNYPGDSIDGRDNRRFAMTSEDMALYLQSASYLVDRVYYTESDVNPQIWGKYFGGGLAGNVDSAVPAYLKKPGFAWNGNAANISATINQGRFLVTHRDHGEKSIGWGDPRYTPANVSALTNGNKLPVVWSANCETGWFDNETDASAADTASTAIHFSEAWERNPNGGAVGIIAATRISFSPHNDHLAWGWMDAIWPSFESSTPNATPVYEMGPVLDYGKYYMKGKYSADIYRQTEFEEFHWFGDPTMEIWTGVPQPLTVSHNASVVAGATSIGVTTNVAGALITVSKATGNGEILGRTSSAVANAATTVPLAKPLAVGEQVSVVVTKHNYRPYEGPVTVVAATPCAVPTVTSNGAGGWTPRIPAYGDIALIKAGHTVTTDFVDTTNLCVEKTGKLISTAGKELWIQASNVLLNQGEIRGADGAAGACPTGTGDASKYVHATPAKNVVIYADTFTNEGNIYGGKGGDDSTWKCLSESSPGKWTYLFTPPIPGCPTGMRPNGKSCNQESAWGASAWTQQNHGEPGYGFPAVGGIGGTVEINGSTFTNKGLIEGGKGGYGHSAENGNNSARYVHGTSIGGLGGAVTVNPDNLSGSINTGTLKGGCGGNVDIPDAWVYGDILWSHNGINPSRPGNGGNVLFNAASQGGKINGCTGSITRWDPTTLKADSNTRFEGSDHVEIYGPGDWVMELGELSEGAVSANKTITIAVGKGGVVDLRGISSKVFKAAEKVEIFADHILLDEGVTFADLADAPVVNVEPAKILYRVALSADQHVIGKGETTVPVRLSILNNGPTEDTYTLTVNNTAGWPISNLPSTVKVNSLKTETLSFDVTLPKEAGENVIAIVATSQGDTNISEVLGIRVVSEGAVVVNSYNATGIINDNAGKPVAGVTVKTGDKTTTTDANGAFEISELLDGDYTMVATKDGYTITPQGFTVKGENVTVNLAAMKAGPPQASGTIVTKTGTPISGAKVEVVKMDNSQVTQTTTTDANGQWKVTGLPAGNYTATVSAPGYQSVVPQFEVSSSEVKVDSSLIPLLTLKMTTSSTLVRPEEKVTYTLTVTNKGTVTATGVGLKLTLPTGLTLDQLNGDTCDASQLSCALPNLTAGAKATITLVVSAGSEGGQFDLSATLTSNEYPSDVSTATLALLPYLSVTPNCTPAKDVPMLGDWQCDWTVELSPEAPETVAKDVQVTVTIPQGVTVSSATADVGTVTPQTAKVLWTLNDLSITGVNRATLTMTMKLTDMFLLALTQEAKVTATNYPAQTARARTAIFIDDSIKVDLALVIDITGSMQGEIDGVKAALKQFIATIDASQSPTVALIVFKDVVTVKAFTKDLNALLKVVDTLKAEGGGTCPEASVEALAKSARHVKAGGQIWFTTDASPYPDADIPSVLDLLKSQNIRLNATVTGDCGEVNSLNE